MDGEGNVWCIFSIDISTRVSRVDLCAVTHGSAALRVSVSHRLAGCKILGAQRKHIGVAKGIAPSVPDDGIVNKTQQ